MHFQGRDFDSDLERCDHLFWTMTGESMESFSQVVQDILPYVALFTRRRQLRVHDNHFLVDVRNKVLMVFIWLRMYPEAAMLSGLFMVTILNSL